MATPSLSVVIPAYNEAGVIGSTLEAADSYLRTCGLPYEILVVDDGSADRTVEIVNASMKTIGPLRLLQSRHSGKGGAVKRGMLEARGAYRLFMDADHSTSIREWSKCALWLKDGYEVVIGSRKMPGAEIAVRQPPLREGLGKVFTRLTNNLLATRVTDITCGFKCFQGQAAEALFGLQRMDGWAFDAEILFLARRKGYRIKEVPVAWANHAATKVRLLNDPFRSLSELLEIRLGAWRGWYPQ